MKKFLLLLALPIFVCASAWAEAVPEKIEQGNYSAWLASIGSARSPYFNQLFAWYEEQKSAPLPSQVAADPDKLFVTVDRPLSETIKAENDNLVEKGITYGLETYGIIDARVETVLETILFRWGKPVGAAKGVTYPVDTVFSFREEKLDDIWGPGSYRSITTLRGGGAAKDQNDISTLLVRGNPQSGYVIFSQYFGPNGRTLSTSSMSIMTIRPMPDGRTEHRVSGRYTGQSYLIFGIDFGRKNYGFNFSRIRVAQKEFYGMVNELKTTGQIAERKL